MTIYAIDHVQLAMPPGEEEKARAFYGGVLGMHETPKPPVLAARGGVWFEAGAVKVHLGVEQDFPPCTQGAPCVPGGESRRAGGALHRERQPDKL